MSFPYKVVDIEVRYRQGLRIFNLIVISIPENAWYYNYHRDFIPIEDSKIISIRKIGERTPKRLIYTNAIPKGWALHQGKLTIDKRGSNED